MFVRTWRHVFLHNCTPHIFGIQTCVNSFSAIETTLKAGDFRIQVVHLWYDHRVVGGWQKNNVFGNTRWLWPVLFMDPEWSEWCGVWGSDSPDCSWTPGFAGEYLRTWGSAGSAACFELEGSWHGHTIWPVDRRETPGWNHPARWEPFSQTKVICRPWKIFGGQLAGPIPGKTQPWEILRHGSPADTRQWPPENTALILLEPNSAQAKSAAKLEARAGFQWECYQGIILRVGPSHL